jgi:hypothetical protein
MTEQESSNTGPSIRTFVFGFTYCLVATAVALGLLLCWTPDGMDASPIAIKELNLGTAAILAYIIILVSCFAAIVYLGYEAQEKSTAGAFIDERNRISLSRFQLILWTTTILSSFYVAVLINIRLGLSDPLAFTIPEEVWVILGISGASTIASPILLKDKGEAKQLATNSCVSEANWNNLVFGEDENNQSYLDVSRLQLLFFSVLSVLAYAWGFISILWLIGESETGVTSLPEFTPTMLTLLGLSHAGYIGAKKGPSLSAKNVEPRQPLM